MEPVIIKIGGEAGFGIMSTGLTLAKLATRSGYEVFEYSEYPSVIRGGHNLIQLAIGPHVVRAPYEHTDVLIALNQDTITRHATELRPGSYILYDNEQTMDLSGIPRYVTRIPLPLNAQARTIGGTILMRNSAALGALLALTSGSLEILNALLDEEFSTKDPDLALRNKKTAEAGFLYAQEHFKGQSISILKLQSERSPRIVISGNEAAALGALAAGMNFATVYPMTPTSAILHTLAPLQENYDFIYHQPEDEISALTMAIGAAFGGARALVATAGGGFCLMTEGYGLAAMTETPVVIIVGMRGGPATGLPTWTEQGDLRFVLHAHQGEFARIVLAPGDTHETFHLTMEAFNLAERYQTPVIILMDKHLCESHESQMPFTHSAYRIDRGKLARPHQKNYARYALTADGISPRAFPGQGTYILANSDEHNEKGFSNEEAANREQMMSKRLRKLALCAANDLPTPTVYGSKNAPITLVSWGSTKGVILEALKDFPEINFLHLTWLSPFPAEFVKRFLSHRQKIALLEVNATGQLEALLAEKTGITTQEHLRKFDGRPFFVEEVQDYLKKLVHSYGLRRKKK